MFSEPLHSDPPVKVGPKIIKFESRERSLKVKQRTYSLEQLQFLKTKCDQPLSFGFIYRNPSSK